MKYYLRVIINMKSRVKGELHARFCGNIGVQFPCVTRLQAMPGKPTSKENIVNLNKL